MTNESSLYFALSSSIVSQARESEVEDLLHGKGMTLTQYKKYEEWWFSQDAESVLDKLINGFIESLVPIFKESFEDIDWETFFSDLDSGAWSDFIREIFMIQKGDTDYFLEYAVDQALLWDFDQELPFFETDEDSSTGVELDELREAFGKWYEKSSLEIKSIFDEVSPLIEAARILSN